MLANPHPLFHLLLPGAANSERRPLSQVQYVVIRSVALERLDSIDMYNGAAVNP